jgi:prevent-host-death family protein
MGVVGVRELGRSASKVVGDVRRTGRPVIVTVNGKPVAVVVPLNQEALEDYVLAYAESSYATGSRPSTSCAPAGPMRSPTCWPSWMTDRPRWPALTSSCPVR